MNYSAQKQLDFLASYSQKLNAKQAKIRFYKVYLTLMSLAIILVITAKML